MSLDDQTDPTTPDKDSAPVTKTVSSHRATLKRIAKWIIAVVVAVGLVIAGRSAISQWQSENEKIRIEIESIEKSIADSDDPGEKRRLSAQSQTLRRNAPSVKNLRWQFVCLAALIYAFSLVPPGFLLHRAAHSLGQRPRLRTAVAAQLLGHVGKYVPGKAMVIVLRSGALAKDEVRLIVSTISVFMETFLMMAVGGAVAGLVICWLPVPNWLTFASIVVAVSASLPTLPPVLRLLATRVAKVESPLTPRAALQLFAAGWFYSLLSWVLIGGAFTCLIYSIPTSAELPAPLTLYAVATAAISLAMVVGFASLLPGGAGIRELVLATVLGVSLGAAHALLAAIAARIVFIVVEACLAAAAWLWLRRQ